MQRIALGLVLVIAASVASAAPAAATPNPNPNAPARAGTACENVLSHNPNTGPNAHSSDVGGQHFGDLGAALCGVSG